MGAAVIQSEAIEYVLPQQVSGCRSDQHEPEEPGVGETKWHPVVATARAANACWVYVWSTAKEGSSKHIIRVIVGSHCSLNDVTGVNGTPERVNMRECVIDTGIPHSLSSVLSSPPSSPSIDLTVDTSRLGSRECDGSSQT